MMGMTDLDMDMQDILSVLIFVTGELLRNVKPLLDHRLLGGDGLVLTLHAHVAEGFMSYFISSLCGAF